MRVPAVKAGIGKMWGIHKPPSEPDLDGSSVAMMSDFQVFVVECLTQVKIHTPPFPEPRLNAASLASFIH
jgi:hypothetical protein